MGGGGGRGGAGRSGESERARRARATLVCCCHCRLGHRRPGLALSAGCVPRCAWSAEAPPAPAPRPGPRAGPGGHRPHHAAAVPELDAGRAHAARGLPHLRRHLRDRRRNRVNSRPEPKPRAPAGSLPPLGSLLPIRFVCAAPPCRSAGGIVLVVWAGGGSVRGPGRFREWMMGARLPRGVPGRGARAAVAARRGESGQAHPAPCPLVPFPGV